MALNKRLLRKVRNRIAAIPESLRRMALALPRTMMSARAQQLLDKIAAHDKLVEEIAKRVTEECKAEISMPTTRTREEIAARIIELEAGVPIDCPSIYAEFCDGVNIQRLQERITAALTTATDEAWERAIVKVRDCERAYFALSQEMAFSEEAQEGYAFREAAANQIAIAPEAARKG